MVIEDTTTHIADIKLGLNGELYACCNGREIKPLGDYQEGTLVFCKECKQIAQQRKKRKNQYA